MFFVGNFQYTTGQEHTEEQNRRHGDFVMMVAAESKAAALDNFRRRILAFRNSSTLFEGRCAIFIYQLLEFEHFPEQEAVMIGFKSFAGDPLMPFIACAVPTEQADACKIHEWHGNHPLTEGHRDSLFIEFTE